jgi:putative ABC transport system substrate-binding protein
MIGHDRKSRRNFIAGAGAATVAWPRAASGQRSDRIRRIGVLVTGAPPHPIVEALPRHLSDLGWVESRTTAFETRYADGRADRATVLAEQLVRLGVDVIVGVQTPAVRAAKNATRAIPIVMGGAGAPVETGLVASLSRPGGNVTGVGDLAAELGGRRLQVLKDIIPNLARVGALASNHDLFTRPFVRYMETAAASAGIRIVPVMVDGPSEFANAFLVMAHAEVQAVVIQGIFNPNRTLSLNLASKHRLPIVTWDRATTIAGGLFSLSSNRAEIYRRTAAFVDRILRGAVPAELPVEQPTTFELEINLRTARALGIAIPASILVQADEVIE